MKPGIRTLFRLLLFAVCLSAVPTRAQDVPYIGEIRMFAGNYAPDGWVICDGQLLSISENDALFSLIGTTYGGDGQTTFAVPDLRGRAPVHAGAGGTLGEAGGSDTVDTGKKMVTTSKQDRTRRITLTKPSRKSNLQPYRGVHYIISRSGAYPSAF